MAILTVGSGQQFTTLTAAVAAAQPGDTIQVQAGIYTNDFPGYVNGLTIEGVGGQANFVATEQPPNGKAILDVGGNTTLKNLSFSGVTDGDGNGAGVRCEGGNLTVENSAFYDNQDGLLGNADPNGTITIDHSEFFDNGTSAGNTHNIYIGDIKQFTLTNSYVHDANVGHEVKSRAENNTITGNRIFDNSGTSSYSIDLPNGGNALISDNVIEQGPNGQNPTIIAYGEEGSLHAGTAVSFTGNTVVNDMTAHMPNLFWNASGAQITASDNTVYGIAPGQMGVGSGLPSSSGFTYTTIRPLLDTSSPVTSTGAPLSTSASIPPAVQGGTFGAGTDTLTVTLAEDAYQGDAQANVAIDGTLLTATPLTVTASYAASGTEVFDFRGNFGTGQHQVAISFLNDAYGGAPWLDRNLYGDSIALNGQQSPDLANGPIELHTTSTDTFGVTGGTSPAVLASTLSMPSADTIQIDDTTLGQTVAPPTDTAYSGPVSYLQNQMIWSSPDSVNITAQIPDVFLAGNAGNDALQVTSGCNVLDGGAGSNFLVGATGADSGHDTFFVDGRNASEVTWDTLANFHSGDAVTLWGFGANSTEAISSALEGAAGYQGATLHAQTGGAGTGINASITFAGVTPAQLASFTMSQGTAGGVNYLYIARP